jgi:hypothetical protein
MSGDFITGQSAIPGDVSDTISLYCIHRERGKHMKRVTAFAVPGLALIIAATTVTAQEQLDRTVPAPCGAQTTDV